MRQDVLDKARDAPGGAAARILDAAEEVFAELGYGAASTREIARRARVPFGALHYYWGSKLQLRKAVMQRLVERIRETITANLVPATEPGAMVDSMTDAFLDSFAANRNATRLLYRNILEPPEARSEDLWQSLATFGIGLLHDLHLDVQIDVRAVLLLVSNAFLGAMADEVTQQEYLDGTVFTSRKARERLRAELRRLNRAAFKVTP